MPASFSVEYEGRTVELVPDALWEQDRVRLVVDGETVAERKANGKKTVLAGDGFEVRAVMPVWGGSVVSATLVPEDSEVEYELDPEPGTRAARRMEWARCHPGLYASRHVVTGVAKVAAAIFGLSLLVGLLPAIPLPSIDLPDLPLPSFQIDLTPPAWIQAVLEYKQYWLPILIGIVLASREVKRRKRLRRG